MMEFNFAALIFIYSFVCSFIHVLLSIFFYFLYTRRVTTHRQRQRPGFMNAQMIKFIWLHMNIITPQLVKCKLPFVSYMMRLFEVCCCVCGALLLNECVYAVRKKGIWHKISLTLLLVFFFSPHEHVHHHQKHHMS